MASETHEKLANEAELAVAHSGPRVRDLLRIFLELDARIGRIVAGTNEPMLGQMRLAWWRDVLTMQIDKRPQGDAVLDAIGAHWGGRSGELTPLIDAWEHLLGEAPLDEGDAIALLNGRRDGLLAVYGERVLPAEGCNSGAAHPDPAYARAAWHWACADLAANVSDPGERAMLVQLGLDHAPDGKIRTFSRSDRGLAVLGALGLRALQRGGRPLMEGRGAALAALRAAIFGR